MSYSRTQVYQSYIETRKWIIQQIQDNFDKLATAKSRQAFEKQLFQNAIDFICQHQKPLEYAWMIHIHYLSTESPCESVCSIIKRLYADNRKAMKYETLKKLVMNACMLPRDYPNRTRIVKWVVKLYHQKYGDSIIHDAWYKNKRAKHRGTDRPPVLIRLAKGDDSGYKSSVFLLE